MKNKLILTVVLIILISSGVSAQSIEEILKIIESNNIEIKVGQKYYESKTYEYKHAVLPSGPQFSYGYFPNNSDNPGPKETFEISQSFQMPCYYRNQSGYSKLMISQEELNKQLLRQNIIFEAQKLLIEYVYLSKQGAEIEKRLEQAKNVMAAYTKKLESGDANILEVNKAKLHLMHVQNHLNVNRTEIISVEKQLAYLNGGQELDLSLADYTDTNISDAESIMNDKINSDPGALLFQSQAESSAILFKVTKNLQLPEFSLGYGGETVADEKFRGIIVGLSVPLWGSSSAIKKAKFESEYYMLNNQLNTEKIRSETNIYYEKAQTLRENLENYKSTLMTLNNIELLKKSLNLGEISSIEYFMEISYFYQVYDDYLMVEKDYYKAVAELLK